MQSPAIGLAIIVVLETVLSRAGFAVKDFAIPLVVTLTIAAVAFHFLKRLPVPRHGTVLLILLFVGVVFIARPFLHYGLDWTTFTSSDMVSYAAVADHLLNHSFYAPPNVANYALNKDISSSYWIFTAVIDERTGADLFLALVTSVTHSSTLRMFVPVMVIGATLVIGAAASLASRTKHGFTSSVVSIILLVFSAMLSYTVVQDFLGHILGLALVLIASQFLSASIREPTNGIIGGLSLGGVALIYPELLPFVLISVFFSILIALSRRTFQVGPFAKRVGVALGVVLLCLNTHASYLINIALLRAHQVEQNAGFETTFPFFLLPSGFSDFWGGTVLAHGSPEPWGSLAIIFGFILSSTAIYAAMKTLHRQATIGTLALAMLSIMTYLIYKRAGYGEFKLALYMQPLIISLAAVGVVSATSRVAKSAGLRLGLTGVITALIVFFSLNGEMFYVNQSLIRIPNADPTFIEVPYVTTDHILSTIETVIGSHSKYAFLSDTSKYPLGRLESLLAKGSIFSQPATVAKIELHAHTHFDPLKFKNPNLFTFARILGAANDKYEPVVGFDLLDGRYNNFYQDLRIDYARKNNIPQIMLGSGIYQTVLNRSQDGSKPDFFSLPLSNVHNHLISIDSTLSVGVSSFVQLVGIYNPEPDYFFPDHTMSALNQLLLLEIVKPSKKVRVKIDLSTSLLQAPYTIPRVRIVGKNYSYLAAHGAGWGRFLSSPIEPQSINGHSYIMLDLGHLGRRIRPEPPSGLRSLFGREFVSDRRYVNAFVRDLSVLDAKLKPGCAETHVEGSTSSLGNPQLLFSGIYEDGWLSKDSSFELCSRGAARLRVKVEEPPSLSGGQILTIRVDGKVDYVQPILPGVSDYVTTNVLAPGHHSIDLLFRMERPLSDADPRPASAHLTTLALEDL